MLMKDDLLDSLAMYCKLTDDKSFTSFMMDADIFKGMLFEAYAFETQDGIENPPVLLLFVAMQIACNRYDLKNLEQEEFMKDQRFTMLFNGYKDHVKDVNRLRFYSTALPLGIHRHRSAAFNEKDIYFINPALLESIYPKHDSEYKVP